MKDRNVEMFGTIALLACAVVVFLVVLASLGCHSSRQCPPCPEAEQVVVEKRIPVPCIIPVAELVPLPAASYPVFPGEAATDEQLKAWALALGEAIEGGDAVCLAQDAAWLTKVREHNAAGPLCAPP